MIRWILSLLLIANIAAAQSFPKDGKLYAQGFGSNTYSTLNVLLTRIGSADATVVCGAGQWAITDNLTFPANVRVEVPFGSGFNISSGKVLTVNGGFEAGVYPVFSGLGTAAGSAEFLYRYTQWGDTNQYNIGEGQIQVANSSISNILNTSADAGQESLTNALLVQATNGEFDNLLGDLSFFGTALFPSNDMAVGFMGYPKLALDTNMITVITAGGTTITIDSFTNAFDNDNSTITTTGSVNNVNQGYLIDLGEDYVGYIVSKHSHTNTAGGVGASGFTYSYEPPFETSGSYEGFAGILSPVSYTAGDFAENYQVQPFAGRYVNFRLNAGGGSTGYAAWIHTLNVYGATNGFRNTGGW